MFNPIFGRQGNKTPIMKTILPLIPSHKLYVEPFVGSGAVFFNKSDAPSILNDLDDIIIYRLNLLKDVNIQDFCNKNPNDFNSLEKLTDFYFNQEKITVEDKIINL